MATGRQRPAPGEIIASDWGGKVWDQSVQTYLSTADRDAQFPTPLDGAIVYVEDADVFYARVKGVWQRFTVIDTGWVDAKAGGLVTATANFTVSTAYLRRIGNEVHVAITGTAKWTSNSNTAGDITNTPLVTLAAAWSPTSSVSGLEQGLGSALAGRTVTYGVTNSGEIRAASMAGGSQAISSGDSLSISGSYLLG